MEGEQQKKRKKVSCDKIQACRVIFMNQASIALIQLVKINHVLDHLLLFH